MKSVLMMLIGTIAVVLATVNSQGATREDLSKYYKSINVQCVQDFECVVKDTGNCCGYYPVCVNENTGVDPQFVLEICKELKLSGLCGFPAIESCKCIEKRCVGIDSEGKIIRSGR